MPKLKLVATPTFTAKVGIPVAGEGLADVSMVFKHRTKSALMKFIEENTEKNMDADTFMSMVSGWDLEEEFNKQNVEALLEIHAGSGRATLDAYWRELLDAKIKN